MLDPNQIEAIRGRAEWKWGGASYARTDTLALLADRQELLEQLERGEEAYEVLAGRLYYAETDRDTARRRCEALEEALLAIADECEDAGAKTFPQRMTDCLTWYTHDPTNWCSSCIATAALAALSPDTAGEA